MEQSRKQPQAAGNQAGPETRAPQPAQWDGHERRRGMADRRRQNATQQRNTTADTRMMNEGSSR